jgi:kumamolisin
MNHILKNYCKPYFKLSQRIKWSERYLQLTDQALSEPEASQSGAFSVPDLCKLYNWPTGLNGGGVIAIVELGGGWVQADMDSFFHSIGQPVPQIIDVSVDGTNNSPNQNNGSQQDADLEVALDIQIAGAAYYVATGKPAVIRVYWATDIAPAVQMATADQCDVCSISWGSDEADWDNNAADQMESAAVAATQSGMITFAASGDNDSADGGQNPANVDLPSSCPHIIGCGGTTKTLTNETVWNWDPGQSSGTGTGGGYSTIFPVQAFQIGAPPAPDTAPGKGRMVPDVSADGDPNTGYIIWVHGNQVSGIGGTSAVAPLYAGLFAAFGTKLMDVSTTLWANQQCFNDITEGDNGAYQALIGPDPCTGIGSPIGTKLAALLAVPTISQKAGASDVADLLDGVLLE